MSYQHVIYCRGCLVSDGERQNTTTRVKRCCGDIAGLHQKVLRGEQFGKIAFDLLINHAFLSTDTSIKGGPHGGDHPVPVTKLVLIDQSFIMKRSA